MQKDQLQINPEVELLSQRVCPYSVLGVFPQVVHRSKQITLVYCLEVVCVGRLLLGCPSWPGTECIIHLTWWWASCSAQHPDYTSAPPCSAQGFSVQGSMWFWYAVPQIQICEASLEFYSFNRFILCTLLCTWKTVTCRNQFSPSINVGFWDETLGSGLSLSQSSFTVLFQFTVHVFPLLWNDGLFSIP